MAKDVKVYVLNTGKVITESHPDFNRLNGDRPFGLYMEEGSFVEHDGPVEDWMTKGVGEGYVD